MAQARRGVLTHETALDLWDVSDVNPAKIHIDRAALAPSAACDPQGLRVHRETLRGPRSPPSRACPWSSSERAVQECAGDDVGRDILEQAARNGRARGLLTAEQAKALARNWTSKASPRRAHEPTQAAEDQGNRLEQLIRQWQKRLGPAGRGG